MRRPPHLNVRLWFCACVALLTGVAAAQSPERAQARPQASLPAWVVLVLKPIGADRVRPVTGVVVSDDGLVIVPAGFAAPGDQIIVLDGGTDIVANGRAAIIRKQLPDVGLTVLSAPALKRRRASVAATPPGDGEEIRLAAFPPAELIAEGAAPVSVGSALALSPGAVSGGEGEQASPGISLAKSLPNVSGPLLDRCGNLVGFSSADGVQSMETNKHPSYVWKDRLLKALQGADVTLDEAPCPLPGEAASATPAGGQQEAEVGSQADMAEKTPAPVADADVPVNRGAEPSASREPAWLKWLGALAMLSLAACLWWLVGRRLGSGNRGELPAPGSGSGKEPESLPSKQAESVSRAADCTVEIRGRLPDGKSFARSCEVSAAAINLVIGRGRADIEIDSPDIHREHARLSGSADMLTITDLGSVRGTWINRVPCLKGEIMFIDPEDMIFLGEVTLQVAIRHGQPDEADTS